MAIRDHQAIEMEPPALIAYIKFLEQIKAKAEHARRFSVDPLYSSRKALTEIEGDIEEFLIADGYWVSEEGC